VCYDLTMKKESETPEYRKFSEALRKVLSVSHDDLKARLADDKARKEQKERSKSSASRAPAASV
jgi:hypothetical protein